MVYLIKMSDECRRKFGILNEVANQCISVSFCQIAVSHTTACGLWQGGVPVLRGSGVFLQLGRMGMLSCLHRLLSGRRWALISLHRHRFLSITSRSLPSRWVAAPVVPAPPAVPAPVPMPPAPGMA